MPKQHPAAQLTSQMDLDFWGNWFFNSSSINNWSEQDVLDAEGAYYMGGEL